MKTNAEVARLLTEAVRGDPMSETELGLRTNIAKSTLRHTLSGNVPVTAERLLRIAVALDKPVTDIIPGLDTVPPKLPGTGPMLNLPMETLYELAALSGKPLIELLPALAKLPT